MNIEQAEKMAEKEILSKYGVIGGEEFEMLKQIYMMPMIIQEHEKEPERRKPISPKIQPKVLVKSPVNNVDQINLTNFNEQPLETELESLLEINKKKQNDLIKLIKKEDEEMG